MDEEKDALTSAEPEGNSPGDQDQSPSASGVPPVPAQPNFPRTGTPEWGQMNRRRAELIRKNLRGELSPAEREEYERLQRLSLAALESSLPGYDAGETSSKSPKGKAQ